jgi:general secretion pathway protein E
MLAAGALAGPMADGAGAMADAEAAPETAPEPALERTESDVPASDADAEQAVILHLRQRGRLSDGDLARAGKLAEDSGEPLRLMLVRLGLVSDRDMAAAFRAVLELAPMAAEDYPDHPVPNLGLSLRFLKYAHMVPLRDDGDALELAVADPIDGSAVQAVEMATGRSAAARRPVQ